MQNIKQLYTIVLILALSYFAMGCAGFKKNMLPEIGPLPPLPAETVKPTVTYSYTSSVDMFTKNESLEFMRKKMAEEFATVLRESGYFASVSEAVSGGEVHIQTHLLNSGNPAAIIPAFITGYSLFVIPSWATDKWTVTAKVTTSDNQEYSYTLDDANVIFSWLPAIILTPFMHPIEVTGEVRKNMYKNLITQMQRDGVLPKSE